MLSQKRR